MTAPTVYTFTDSNGTVRLMAEIDPAPGGSQPGVAIVRAFPFAYNSPGILTGHSIGYTPGVGDILLDAWIEIDTAWNGTTPFADIGSFVGNNSGFFAFAVGPVSVGGSGSGADGENPPGLLTSTAATSPGTTLSLLTLANGVTNGARYAPAKFTTANPIKVCVSQDGTNTGANPGAGQGAAVLYLVTATPT